MPINAHPDYLAAEKEYLSSVSLEDRIEKLKKMISLSPGHKGAENLRAQLKTRLKKLTSQLEKNKKISKLSGKEGIKKEGVQAAIIGFTNSGKSTLLNFLTNTNSKISPGPDVKFTTKSPVVGMMSYGDVEFQLIENPAFESEFYNKGLVHTADILLLLVTEINQIPKLKKELDREKGKQIIVYNKTSLLNSEEKRKISANMQSKKYNFVLISTKTHEGMDELKEKLLENSGKIRIYTKHSGKGKKSKGKPVILNPDSIVRDVAEKILKGFSRNVKETKIWGPSSKFPGQKVGLNHKLKDLDVVEFKTG